MENILIALGLLVLVCGSFFLQGYRKIPNNPPHKGLLTIFGRRTEREMCEGWHFFPFFPWFYGVIPVDITKKNIDLRFNVRTPDLAELEVPINITYTPSNLKAYLDAGGENGIKSIITDVVGEKLRVWAIATDEGPQTAEEALKAADQAVAILIKAIAGDNIDPVPSSVPTPILLKYFAEPRQKPTQSEKKDWGENWEKVAEILTKEAPENYQKIKEAVEKRRQLIKALRQANGVQPLPQLGITLNRLNISDIKAIGKFAEAADLDAKEQRERKAELTEISHVIDIVSRVKNELKISTEQALEIVQTERGKVKKEISEKKLNISEETREMIQSITPKILGNLVGKADKKEVK